MVKRILIICPFPQGVAAGQRLKYEQYFEHWQEHEYIVDVSPFMDLKMWKVLYIRGNYFSKICGTIKGTFRRIINIFQLKKYDIVYVFMWVTPLGSTLFERIFRKLSKRLIFDIEDNIIYKKRSVINPIINLLKGSEKTIFLITEADHVITSSPYLNDCCLQFNKKKSCSYISSSVDVEKFVPINKYNNHKKITIGWTGTFSSKIYLDSLKNVFYRLNEKYKFKLRVIGNFEYNLANIDIEVIQWTEETEVSDLQEIDIGIYPLIPSDWVLGKSGLKAIQYMAFGLPTVATSFGTTQKIIKHMENGCLVSSEDDWIIALENLINNPELRRKLGTAARITVVNNYSTEIIKNDYLKILNKLMKDTL
jgi:glycosyltransferase involved in cell wall biosynthesis